MSEISLVQNELEFIKHTLKNFPGGAVLDDIAQVAGIDHLSLRTLQRRLGTLRLSCHVATKGKTLRTRYH